MALVCPETDLHILEEDCVFWSLEFRRDVQGEATGNILKSQNSVQPRQIFLDTAKQLLNSNFFSEFVHFNKRNKNLIFVFILLGIISVILFQNLKPAYYETKAICMSGISEYERLEQLEELSQRTAVDLINYLQINVSNKDYGQLVKYCSLDAGNLLGLSNEEVGQELQYQLLQEYCKIGNRGPQKLHTHPWLCTILVQASVPKA